MGTPTDKLKKKYFGINQGKAPLEKPFIFNEYMMYVVKHPFMARKGQFGEGQTLCVGIEKDALRNSVGYRCYLGHNLNDFYCINYDEAMGVVAKFGDKNVLWKRNGRVVFILPLFAFDHEQQFEDKETIDKPVQLSLM